MRYHMKFSESRIPLLQTIFVSHMSVGYYPQGGNLCTSPVITNIMQYSQTCKRLPVFLFIYQFAPYLAGKDFFFIYTCVISYKFVLASLRKPCDFFYMVFDGKPTPSIPEPTSLQRLLYIKTIDPGIDVGLQTY